MMTVSNELKIILIQADLVWENPTENRNRFEEKINQITTDVAIIILPEMFTTGFTMNTSLAETMNGKTVLWMQKLAKKHHVAIVGSIIIKENGLFYNRMLFVYPSGKITHYNKRHLFTLAGEEKVFTAGNKHAIVSFKGWKIKLQICYDLRFPVWARNTENYDILLYVASWPKPRISAWDTLLKARAIENMSYVIGVNRVGTDANNYTYIGNSIVFNELGEAICPLNSEKETIIKATLIKSELEKTRTKLAFLKDADSFTIHKK